MPVRPLSTRTISASPVGSITQYQPLSVGGVVFHVNITCFLLLAFEKHLLKIVPLVHRVRSGRPLPLASVIAPMVDLRRVKRDGSLNRRRDILCQRGNWFGRRNRISGDVRSRGTVLGPLGIDGLGPVFVAAGKLLHVGMG